NVLQAGRSQLHAQDTTAAAVRPLHIFRDTMSARQGERLAARGDVHSIAVDVAIATNDVAEMNSDPQFDLTLVRNIMIALCERPLDFDRTLHCFECAAEFEQESVPDRFDLGAVEARENFAHDSAMLLEQFER